MKSKGLFSVAKNALVPSDGRAKDMFGPGSLKLGDKVLITVHRARNPEHNSVVHLVFDRIGRAIGQTSAIVKLWIKWETGYVDIIKLPNGMRMVKDRSTKFTSMTQDAFQQWWDEAWPIIGEKILPGIPEKDFQEIRDIVNRRVIT